jgi:hypothetical protein
MLGIKVSRATANLPQTTNHALFTIPVRILVTGIIGEVTTVIQTQANNTKLLLDATAGASADVDICAVLDITGDAVGQLYGVTGTFTDALVGAGAAAPFPARRIVLEPGTLNLSCAASNTGQVKWDLWYIPLEQGNPVTAA